MIINYKSVEEKMNKKGEREREGVRGEKCELLFERAKVQSLN